LFPDQFPDGESDLFLVSLESMLLEADELLDPDNPRLQSRRESLKYDIQQLSLPAVMVGPGNALDSLRNSYIENRVSLELEGLNVSKNTSSVDYWQYIVVLSRRNKTKSSITETLE
jgi:hypothetical protein